MNKEVVPHSGMPRSFVVALLTEPSAQCPRGRRVRQQMKGFPADTDTEAGFSREQYARSGFDSRLNPRSCVVRPLTAAGSVICRVLCYEARVRKGGHKMFVSFMAKHVKWKFVKRK